MLHAEVTDGELSFAHDMNLQTLPMRKIISTREEDHQYPWEKPHSFFIQTESLTGTNACRSLALKLGYISLKHSVIVVIVIVTVWKLRFLTAGYGRVRWVTIVLALIPYSWMWEGAVSDHHDVCLNSAQSVGSYRTICIDKVPVKIQRHNWLPVKQLFGITTNTYFVEVKGHVKWIHRSFSNVSSIVLNLCCIRSRNVFQLEEDA